MEMWAACRLSRVISLMLVLLSEWQCCCSGCRVTTVFSRAGVYWWQHWDGTTVGWTETNWTAADTADWIHSRRTVCSNSTCVEVIWKCFRAAIFRTTDFFSICHCIVSTSARILAVSWSYTVSSIILFHHKVELQFANVQMQWIFIPCSKQSLLQVIPAVCRACIYH